jgi:hypothetical protein
MGQAMADLKYSDELWEQRLRSFFQTADWMRNEADLEDL